MEKRVNPCRNAESEIYLIVLFKEGVKNLRSCVEALKVKQDLYRGEPGVITQVGLVSLPSGSPGSVLGQPKAETSLHCNSCLFRFSKHQQERSQCLKDQIET